MQVLVRRPLGQPRSGLLVERHEIAGDVEEHQPGAVVSHETTYAFDLPRAIDGDAVLRITNAGTEPHEMTVLRLDDGATADDVSDALAAGAPPPGTAVGGMQALLPGATQQLQLDLEPGEYAVICHVPSPDGTPHHVRGMIRQVTVG